MLEQTCLLRLCITLVTHRHSYCYFTVLIVEFFAVYPEFIAKTDIYVDYGLIVLTILFESATVMSSYSVYYNNTSFTLMATILQVAAIVILVYCTFHWLIMVAARQNAKTVRLDGLTVDEYVAMSYSLPLVLQTLAIFIWSVCTGHSSWQSRSETDLIFHLASLEVMTLALIRKNSNKYCKNSNSLYLESIAKTEN